MQDSSVTALVDLILSEGAIGMTPAARLLGTYRNGRSTTPSTVIRYWADGVLRQDGTRVHLEAVRISGKIMTSRQRIVAFIAAQNEPSPTSELTLPQSPRAHRRAADEAERELDALGVRA